MLEEDIKMINNIPMKNMLFGEKERKQHEKENICWIFDDIPNENGYKKIKKFGIIVILLVSIEELHITYVILNIKKFFENPILHLWYFIILVGMIVIYL